MDNLRVIIFLLSLRAGTELSGITRARLARALGEMILDYGALESSAREGTLGGTIETKCRISLEKLQTLLTTDKSI